MGFIISIVFISICLYLSYQFVRIILSNQKKITEIIVGIRDKQANGNDYFPLVTQRPAMPGNSASGLTTFDTRTIIDYDNADKNWIIYLITPAGIQRRESIPVNELEIRKPDIDDKYLTGINIISHVGFISAKYICASDDFKLHPSKQSVSRTKELVEEFCRLGAKCE